MSISRVSRWFFLFVIGGLLFPVVLAANTSPVVSRVRVVPLPYPDQRFLIKFDLFDAEDDLMTVSIHLLKNAGSQYLFECNSIFPPAGAMFRSGSDRSITWDAPVEYPDHVGDDYVIRVVADDGVIEDEIVLQPGPVDGMDVFLSSYYSWDSDYGVDNDILRAGGWADWYYTLIRFDVSSLPSQVYSATLYLYTWGNAGGSNVGMYLDRVLGPWNEDTGWYTKPSAQSLRQIPAPTLGSWYSLNITDLYNGWKSGTYPNYGLQLRPTGNWNQFNEFYSSDFIGDQSLRPKLIIRTVAP
jgi:hypothetical protein